MRALYLPSLSLKSDKIKKQIKKGHTAVQALGAIGSPMLFDMEFNYINTKSITQ